MEYDHGNVLPFLSRELWRWSWHIFFYYYYYDYYYYNYYYNNNNYYDYYYDYYYYYYYCLVLARAQALAQAWAPPDLRPCKTLKNF